MKAASLSDIKKELLTRPPKEIYDICLCLAKFSKENKELLTYLLYEKENEAKYIKVIKLETEQQFDEINNKTPYFVKKSIRKILRILKKSIKYSKIKTTEADLLLHFCRTLINYHPKLKYDKVLFNIYTRQLEIVKKAISKLHEDLQYDYFNEIEEINSKL